MDVCSVSFSAHISIYLSLFQREPDVRNTYFSSAITIWASSWFSFAFIGSAVPDRVVTNADLGHLGCDPEWILSRSGIQERRHVDPGMATSDLAVQAAERALAACGDVRDKVDLLVLGTFTPTRVFHPRPVWFRTGWVSTPRRWM